MRKVSRKSVFFAALSAVLGLSAGACDWFADKDPYSVENSANFISEIGFDDLVAASAVTSTAITGQWDFAYRYLAWDGFDYLSLTPIDAAAEPGYATEGDCATTIGESLPDGLAATAPVYRLELRNLAQNGDFEDSADDPATNAQWVQDQANKATAALITSGAINSQSIQVSLPANQFAVTYALDPLNLTASTQYTVDFRWKGDTASIDIQTIYVDSSDVRLSFNPNTLRASADFLAGTAAPVITFKSESGYELTVDDVTLRKTEGMRLRLLLTKTDTRTTALPTLDLEDGAYRFSVYVHIDPSVGASTNPYHLDSFTCDLEPIAEQSTMSHTAAEYSYASAVAAASPGWIKLTAETGASQAFQVTGDGTVAVMELVLDATGSRPGRVLIAQPELRFASEGF